MLLVCAWTLLALQTVWTRAGAEWWNKAGVFVSLGLLLAVAFFGLHGLRVIWAALRERVGNARPDSGPVAVATVAQSPADGGPRRVRVRVVRPGGGA